MDISLILIAFGLAMDSFSVSVTRGFTHTKTRLALEALRTGFFFGLFRAFMPLIGWLTGVGIIDLISGFDHWIAFSLLALIGARMIYESIIKKSKQVVSSPSIKVLLMLSLATSFDALTVGLSLSFLGNSIITPALIIGIVTFFLSFLGVIIGKKFGTYFTKIGILGGLILIAIGLRILIEHLEILV